MSTLQLPTGENVLLAAFRALETGQVTKSSDLVAEYERHFTTAVSVPKEQPQVFERFSIVDPSIRMTVQSSTAFV